MKKTLITMFMLLAGSLALTAAPQSYNQPQTDEQSNPPSQSQISRDRVTMTGCLMQGTSPNTYVLNHAMPSDTSSSSNEQNDQDQNQARADMDRDMNMPSDQQTSQIPSEEARTENSYTLIPEGRVDLKSHIGHKVEVTGKMMHGASTTTETQRSNTPTGQMSQSQSSMHTNQPEIRVMSIRHIAEACQ